MTDHVSATASVPSRLAAVRRGLLLSCAFGLAAGGVGTTGRAAAQAFEAVPNTTSGFVTYDRATPGVETITVETPSAIIEWTPNNPNQNPIIFLPPGRTATFQNGVETTGFAVLNRILATNPVRFDGTVIGRLLDYTNQTSSPGGTILFSSPGGIIVGANAVFDVGNLVLTTLDVADNQGEFITATGQMSFVGGSDFPDSAIVTEAGAQISALAENSFVAMVAPRIEHGGSVRVNGSVAYVAGEEVFMQVNQGLFDIFVTTGTGNATPIVHTGSTGGPASSGVGDTHRVYMVAVPKNQAITMLLEGNVGFDAATDVTVENGAIVLSAGGSVFGGSLGSADDGSGIDANIHLRGNWTSRVDGIARTDFFALAEASHGDLNFASDVSIRAGARAHLGATGGHTATVGGNLLVSTDTGFFSNGADSKAGESLIYAEAGSTVDIAGQATVSAVAHADGPGATATGGTAHVFTDGGAIQIGGGLTVSADAFGIEGGDFGGGANAAGGVALVTANNGSIDIIGPTEISAVGRGAGNSGGNGGNGTGGTAVLDALAGGSVSVGGDLFINTDATGGHISSGTGDGGTGQAGTSRLVARSGGLVVVQGTTTVFAGGFGGSAQDGAGGEGRGGTSGIYGDGGGIVLSGTTVIDAIAGGGFSLTGAGGAAFGGTAELVAIGVSLPVTDVHLLTGADGGSGQTGGAAQGGSTIVFAKEGKIAGDSLFADSGATGGNGAAGGNGGAATGGSVQIIAESGAAASTIDFAFASASASAFGGAGGAGTLAMAGGNGGDAQGGTAQIAAGSANGTLAIGNLTVDLTATGGQGGQGGDADTGGTAGNGGSGGNAVGGNTFALGTYSGAAPLDGIYSGSATFGSVGVDATGFGGSGGAGGIGSAGGAGGAGGSGQGGGATLLARGSSLTVTETASLVALGQGGDGGASGSGGAAGAGGAGIGGRAGLLATNIFNGTQPATVEIAALGATASGFGGIGGTIGASRWGNVYIDVVQSSASIGIAHLVSEGDEPARATPLASSPGQAADAVYVRALNGTLEVTGDLLLSAPGDVVLVSDGGLIDVAGQFQIGAGGSILDAIHDTPTVNPTVVRAGTFLASAGGDFRHSSPIETAGLLQIEAAGLIDAAQLVAGTDLFLFAGGEVFVGTISSGGDVDITSQEGGIVADRIDAGESIALTAPGAIVAGTLNAGDSVTAVSTGSFVQVTSASAGIETRSTAVDARHAIGIDAATDATLGSGSAFGDIGMLARSGSVSSTQLDAGGSIVGLADQAIGLGAATAGGAVYLAHSSMASLLGPGFDPAGLIGETPVATNGPISISGAVGAQQFVAATSGNFSADGPIDAGERLFVASGGLADFEQRATATAIEIRSADIGFGSEDTGGLGDSSTQSILLVVNPDAEAISIGGEVSETGYSLEASELSQLVAADIVVTTESSAPPTITLGAAVLNGSAAGANANLTGPNGRFSIETGGSIRVVGDFRIENAADGTELNLAAGDRIEVITPAGGLRVLDASGNPGGVLSLAAAHVWATDAALAEQLSQDINFAGRDDALAENAGEDRPRGHLEGGTVVIAVDNSLLVQNSGTETDFAGITVGEGGLFVSGPAEGEAAVFAFGRRLNADGSFTSGNDFFAEADFHTASSGYTAESEFNGCLIATGACSQAVNDPDPILELVAPATSSSTVSGPVNSSEEQQREEEQEQERALSDSTSEEGSDDRPEGEPQPGDDEDAGEDGGARESGAMGTQLIDTSGLEAEQIVDEPVTSGGEASLWSAPDAEADGDDDQQDEAGNGPGEEGRR